MKRLIEPKQQPRQQIPDGGEIREGHRNSTLFSIACSMRCRGCTEQGIDRRCRPPLLKSEVQNIAKSSVRYDPQADDPADISIKQIINITMPDLGTSAYHGFTGDFIRAFGPYTEAADAGVLGTLLPALGAIIGPSPHVWGGGDHPPRINTVLVGPTSSGRKGTSTFAVDAVMSVADSHFWPPQLCRGLATGEGLIKRVTDIEKRNGDIIAVDKRLVVLEQEFSKVLAQAKRPGSILSQILRECFDTGDLEKLTLTEPLRTTGAHICMTGHITPRELKLRFDEVEMDIEIRRHHVEAALAIWQYNEESVNQLFKDKTGDALADKLVGLLKEHGAMTMTRFNQRMNIPHREIRTALEFLKTLGRVEKLPDQKTGPGWPTERWQLVE